MRIRAKSAKRRGVLELVPAVGERTCPPPLWLCVEACDFSAIVDSRDSARTSPLGDGGDKSPHSTASRKANGSGAFLSPVCRDSGNPHLPLTCHLGLGKPRSHSFPCVSLFREDGRSGRLKGGW